MCDNITILEERHIFYHKPMNCWVARIKSMGLTAYGDIREEAAEKIERMLKSSLRARHQLGSLEEWLTKRGVRWIDGTLKDS